MRSFVQYTLKQVVFLNVVFVIIVFTGIYSIFTSSVENMPPVDMGRVLIDVVYYGASAEDVESLVTDKIEDAIDGLENIEFVKSTSRRNYSNIDVKFIDDTDYVNLFKDLRFRVLNIKSDLPKEVDEPVFQYLDTQYLIPVIVVNITGEVSNRTLKLLAEEFKSELINIPGVLEVELSGDYKNEFHISLDPKKLRKYGITFEEAGMAIKSANTKIPTGRFKHKSHEYMLDTGERFNDQSRILNTIVRRDGDGNFLTVSDLVTNVMLSHRQPDTMSSANGQSTIKLIVKKEKGANSLSIADEVRRLSKRFTDIHQRDDVNVVLTNDSTIEIKDSVRTLSGNMILGMILVTLILWMTLGFRNAMLASVGIPFSFLVAIVFLRFTGESINTISLFSFVLVSGIIVDDAIILIENVYRHLETGKPLKEAVISGVSEVILPIFSSILTSILAFIPMLLMTGTTGAFFSVIPKAVSFALIASLIESLFILPIHILDWGPKKLSTTNNEKENTLFSGIFNFLWKQYKMILSLLLNHKVVTLLATVALFIISIVILGLSVSGMMPLIKVDFFPGNCFRYHVPVFMPPGTAIEETDRVVRDLSRYIMSFGKKQAESASGTAGYYEDIDYEAHLGHNFGQVIVTLPEQKDIEFPENPENDPLKHLDFMREKLNQYIDENYSNRPKPELRIFAENTGPPVGKAVNIRVTGNTLEDINVATDEILDFLKREEEFKDLIELEDNRADLQTVVKFTPKLKAIYEYNLTPDYVTSIVAGALNGYNAGLFRTTDEEVDLLVRLARVDDKGNFEKSGITMPSEVLNLPVIENGDSPVFVGDLVTVRYLKELSSRQRYNGKPSITITSNIRDGSQLSPNRVQYLVKNFFDKRAYQHPGVTLVFAGEFESTGRAYSSLTIAFFVAVLAIYMVLASQFNDYFQPVIILSAVAFAITGVILGVFLTRSPFTLGSFLAIVGLAGVSVNDSLIMIEFMNIRRNENTEIREAVLHGCNVRMRPVLITTITTITGLLPMAIGIPNKSISWTPMATAFVTGLASATLLTLLIIPVEFELLEKFKEFRLRMKKRS